MEKWPVLAPSWRLAPKPNSHCTSTWAWLIAETLRTELLNRTACVGQSRAGRPYALAARQVGAAHWTGSQWTWSAVDATDRNTPQYRRQPSAVPRRSQQATQEVLRRPRAVEARSPRA